MFHVAGLAAGPGTLTGSCGDNPGIACRLAWDVTHSPNVAQLVRVYLAGPVSQGLRILLVIVVALLVRAVAHRVINKLTERAATAALPVAPAIRTHRAATPRADTPAVEVHRGQDRADAAVGGGGRRGGG